MIVYFPIFKIYVMLCLTGWFKKSIIQLKPTRQYPVPVVTSCVITAEPVNPEDTSRFPSITAPAEEVTSGLPIEQAPSPAMTPSEANTNISFSSWTRRVFIGSPSLTEASVNLLMPLASFSTSAANGVVLLRWESHHLVCLSWLYTARWNI